MTYSKKKKLHAFTAKKKLHDYTVFLYTTYIFHLCVEVPQCPNTPPYCFEENLSKRFLPLHLSHRTLMLVSSHSISGNDL